MAPSCDALKQSMGYASCSASADGGCRCNEMAASVVSGTGTWSAAGNNVTLTDTGSALQTTPYCVTGNTLQIAFFFGEVLLFTRS